MPTTRTYMKTIEATPLIKLQKELRATVPDGIKETTDRLKLHLAEGSESHKTLLALEARFNDVKKQRMLDVISDEQLRRELNRIRVDLLDLIDQLNADNMAAPTEQVLEVKPGTGHILHRIPRKMEVLKLTRCIVRVAVDEATVREQLELDDLTNIEAIRISDVMQVSLIALDDELFEIRSVHDPVQIIYPTGFTEWVIYVKPLQVGRHPLLLKVSVIELLNGKERKHELVFEKEVEIFAIAPEVVEEEPFSLAYSFSTGIDPEEGTARIFPLFTAAKVQRYAAAVLGLVSTAALCAVFFLGLNSPSNSPPAIAETERPTPQELEAWAIARDSCDRHGLLNILENFPDSVYSLYQDSAKIILHQCGSKLQPEPPVDPPEREPEPVPVPEPDISAKVWQGGEKLPDDFTKIDFPLSSVNPLDLVSWQEAFDLDIPNSYQVYLEKEGLKHFKADAKKRHNELVEQATPNKARAVRPHSDMVRVIGGTFNMGCTQEQGGSCQTWEKPAHEVTEYEFYIDRHEVTNQQYADFLNAYGSNRLRHGVFKGKIMVTEHKWGIRFKRGEWQPQRGFENYPVTNVTWFGANEYARFYGLRLPTEAEWEYAARGGSLTEEFKYSGSNDLDATAWYSGNSGKRTHPVGQKAANELGLYDMSGNVKEWCLDDMRSYANRAEENPRGDAYHFKLAIRGGSWKTGAEQCRVSARAFLNASFRYDDYGFRCVRVGVKN